MTNITKSYTDIYVKNLLLGFQVGEASYIAQQFSNITPLYDNPITNRAIDGAIFNIEQDRFFIRINCDHKNSVDNPLYLGMLQAVKYFPNLLVQNHMKSILYNKDDALFSKTIKAFAITSVGMHVFFTIGAIESKILDEYHKWSFTSTSLVGILGYYAAANMKTASTAAGAVNLSPTGAALATAGIISSFAVPDLMHSYGIKSLSLNKMDLYGFNMENILSLSALSAVSLVKDKYDSTMIGARIAAFSIAKADAVTGVEFLYDAKETICEYSWIAPACKYLGVIEDSTA